MNMILITRMKLTVPQKDSLLCNEYGPSHRAGMYYISKHNGVHSRYMALLFTQCNNIIQFVFIGQLCFAMSTCILLNTRLCSAK